MKHLRLIITIALFISCALQSFAVDEYYLNKAESYRRDAEYYFEKAKGYDKINSCIAISLQWENVKNTILERKI